MAVTLISYSVVMFRTFGERLRPDADVGTFDRADTWLERRIGDIDRAQHGNMTLYSGENPFIGAGDTNRVWSIAVELNRAPGRAGGARDRAGQRDYVPISTVDLHRAIRARLLLLRDPELPPNERIAALSVADHVVGDGQCRWDSPIIDQARTMPYSQASAEAVDALIRHPQAGLRYYQRVCVSDEGQEVWVGNRQLIGRTDQEVCVSAFIYAAVEGRMFYLEFVSTILPPIRPEYHVIDHLPKVASGTFYARVVAQSAKMAFGVLLRAPVGVAGALRRNRHERKTFSEEAAAASDYVYGDVGAVTSIRELGASAGVRTYIQRLDVAKYTKIVERVTLNAVADFLADQGVDAGGSWPARRTSSTPATLSSAARSTDRSAAASTAT